nr:MAG TPA: YfiB membrane protein [Caudoviricetes sp.]
MNIRLSLSPSAILALLLVCFALSHCQHQPAPETCKESAQ